MSLNIELWRNNERNCFGDKFRFNQHSSRFKVKLAQLKNDSDPLRNGSVLLQLLCELDLDAEGLVGRLK